MRSTDSPMDDYESWARFDEPPADAGELADAAWGRHHDDPEPEGRPEYHQQRVLTAGEIAAREKVHADLEWGLRRVRETFARPH